MNFQDLSSKLGKFASIGAIGAAIAAIPGGVFVSYMAKKYPLAAPPQSIVLLFDESLSMEDKDSKGQSRIYKVKQAAAKILEKADLTSTKIAVVGFSSPAPNKGRSVAASTYANLTNDRPSLIKAVENLSTYAGTFLQDGLQEARRVVDQGDGSKFIVVFTDGEPNKFGQGDTTEAAMKESSEIAQTCKNNGITIATIGATDGIQAARLDRARRFLKEIPSSANLYIEASDDPEAITQAFTSTYEQISKSFVSKEKGTIYPAAQAAGFSALVAAGLALALVLGQNTYLKRETFPTEMAAKIVAMGLVAGFASGYIANALAASNSKQALSAGAYVAAWAIMGAGVGLGLGALKAVPNLDPSRASFGGAVGGGGGGFAFFNLPTASMGEIPGQMAGAACVGLAIGAAVVFVEFISRHYFLRIRYGAGEERTVTLGAYPVVIGNDSGATIYSSAAGPQAAAFFVADSRVILQTPSGSGGTPVSDGYTMSFGTMQVTVCGSQTAPAPDPVLTPQTPRQTQYVPGPLTLTLSTGQRFLVQANVSFNSSQIPGLESRDNDGIVAIIGAHPNDPTQFLLQNRSKSAWAIATPEKPQARPINVGEAFKLAAGTTISFGTTTATLSN